MVDTDLERVTSESERTSAGRPAPPVHRRPPSDLMTKIFIAVLVCLEELPTSRVATA